MPPLLHHINEVQPDAAQAAAERVAPCKPDLFAAPLEPDPTAGDAVGVGIGVHRAALAAAARPDAAEPFVWSLAS